MLERTRTRFTSRSDEAFSRADRLAPIDSESNPWRSTDGGWSTSSLRLKGGSSPPWLRGGCPPDLHHVGGHSLTPHARLGLCLPG